MEIEWEAKHLGQRKERKNTLLLFAEYNYDLNMPITVCIHRTTKDYYICY